MMAIMSKNVFIVKCDRSLFEKNFSRKKNSDIINKYEICQKLTNNDSSKIPPSEDIVNFQIVKKLNTFRECKKTEFVYFLKEDIDSDFLAKLKNLFSNCHVPVYYHLLSEDDSEQYSIKKDFHSVHLIQYDKN
jgi:hypothetical protein